MTEAEAMSLAIRLTHIWVPEHPIVIPKWFLSGNHFRFICELEPEVSVSFNLFLDGMGNRRVDLDWGDCELCWLFGQVRFGYRLYPEEYPENSDAILSQFTTKWMPLFRRNCHLSGCTIECSAHEQLEWQKWLQDRESLQMERRLLMA